MIVRNEAAVILRCLSSVRPAVAAWAIVDTGSSDGTQQLIRDFMGDLPGELIERPWVDFATNRNQALELARGYGEYALIIDADEILEIDDGIDWPNRLDAAAYYLRQRIAGGEFDYASAKLLRHDAGWTWEGVLHEYPAATPQPALLSLQGLRVLSYPDGARSQRPARDKYLDDVRVLKAALRDQPDQPRYQFYLAQSLRDAGEPAAALDAYRQRITLGGWDEEVWYSRFQVGVLLERLQAPAAEVIDAYLAAVDSRPSRAEPLCELARYLRLTGRCGSAYVHARAAAELPATTDLLFVDRSVQRWRARDEQAVAAFYTNRKPECAVLCRALLADPALPADQRARVQANLDFCG